MQPSIEKKNKSIFSQQIVKASTSQTAFSKCNTEHVNSKQSQRLKDVTKFNSMKYQNSLPGNSRVQGKKIKKIQIKQEFNYCQTMINKKMVTVMENLIQNESEEESPSKYLEQEHEKILINNSSYQKASKMAFLDEEYELDGLYPLSNSNDKEQQASQQSEIYSKDSVFMVDERDNVSQEKEDQESEGEVQWEQDYNEQCSKLDQNYSLEIRIIHNFSWVKKEFLCYMDDYKLLLIRKILFAIYSCFQVVCYNISKSTLLDIYEIIITLINIMLLLNMGQDKSYEVQQYQYILLILYFLDAIIHLIGEGLRKYLVNFWNLYDLTILILYFLFTFNRKIISFDVSTFRLIRIPIYFGRLSQKLQIMLISIASALSQIVETLLIVILFTVLLALIMLFAFNGMTRYRCMHEELGIFSLLPYEQATCGYIDCQVGFICSRQLNNIDTPTNFDNIIFAYFQTIRTSIINDWTITMYMLMKQFHPLVCFYFILVIFIIGKFAFQLVIAVLKCYYRRTQQYYEINGFNQPSNKDLNLKELKNFGIWNQLREYLYLYQNGQLGTEYQLMSKSFTMHSANQQKVIITTRLLSARQHNEIENQRNKLEKQFSSTSWIIKCLLPNHLLQKSVLNLMNALKLDFADLSIFIAVKYCDHLSIVIQPKKVQSILFLSEKNVIISKSEKPEKNQLYFTQQYDIAQCQILEYSRSKQRFPIKRKYYSLRRQQQSGTFQEKQESLDDKVNYYQIPSIFHQNYSKELTFTYQKWSEILNEKQKKTHKMEKKCGEIENQQQHQLQYDFLLSVITKHNWSGIDVLRGSGNVRDEISLHMSQEQVMKKNKQLLLLLNQGWVYNFTRGRKYYFTFLQFNLLLLISNPSTQIIIDGLICINILILAFQDIFTLAISEYSDFFINIILVGELIIKGMCIKRHFTQLINIVQGCLIILSIIQMTITMNKQEQQTGIFNIVKILKSLFFLRVVKYNVFASNIMQLSYQTFPNYASMALLLFFFILNYAIVGMQIFNFPNSNYLAQLHFFGNIYQTWLAVYDVGTGDDWYGLVNLSTSYSNDLTAFLYTISLIFIINQCGFGLSFVIILDGFTNYFENAQHQQQIKQEEQYHPNLLPLQTLEGEENTNLQQKDNHSEINNESSSSVIRKQSKLFIICSQIIDYFWYQTAIQIITWGSLINLIAFSYHDEFQLDRWNLLEIFRCICNIFLVLDAVMQIMVQGAFKNDGYFNSLWMVLDFIYIHCYFLSVFLNHKVLKWLLFLGYLRPLKATSYYCFFKNEREAIFNSLRDILQILYVILLFWFMFAIFGMALYEGKLGYCDSYLNFGINKEKCKGEWIIYIHNFDTIMQALQTLFIVSTLDGWGVIMFICINSNTADEGPIRFNSEWPTYLFFFTFTFIGALFFVQFFAGILFINYQQNKSQLLNPNLTLDQELFLKLSNTIMKETPNFSKPAKTGFRLKAKKLLNNKYYQIIIKMSLFLNLCILILFNEQADDYFLQIQNIGHHLLTFAFVIDCLVKLTTYHFTRYFDDGWRQFEFLFSFLGLLDFIFDIQVGWYLQYVRAPRDHPYFLYLRLFSLNRCLMMILIVQLFTRIRKLLNVIYFNKMTIIRILGLFTTVLSCYSYIGCELFATITMGEIMNDQLNFTNFFYGMLALFKCVTENGWRNIFSNSINDNGQGQPSYLAAVFYYSLILIASRILMTLLVSEFVQEFERFYDTNSSCLEIYIETIDKYRNLWCKYTEDSEGQQIEARYLARFLLELGEPLGAQQGDNIWDAAKQASLFQLKKDLNGNISFRNLLYEVFKQSFKEKIFKISSVEGKKIMKENDKKIKYRLYNQRSRHLRREVVTEFVDLQCNFNLLQEYLQLFMALKAWKAFSKIFFAVAEDESQTINYTERDVEVKIQEIQKELEGDENHLQGAEYLSQRRRCPSVEHLRRPTDVYILPYYDEVAKQSKSIPNGGKFTSGTISYMLKPTEQKQQNKLKQIAVIKKKEQFIKVNDNKNRRDAIDKPFLNRNRYLYGYHDKMVIKQSNEETAERVKSRIDVDLIPSTYNIMKIGSRYR